MTFTTAAHTAPQAQRSAPAAPVMISEADCTATKLTATIAVSQIGEPVSGVTLAAPAWVAAAGNAPAHCRVDGSLLPVDKSPSARPINFRVLLPASWNRRAVQLGGGGINGVIPNLTGGDGPGSMPLIARGIATCGSDSGHQIAFGRRGEPGPAGQDDWALNDEAIKNFGYMQMKKTHDAAVILMERASCAAGVQLLRRHVTRRPRSVDRSAAVSSRLRRYRGKRPGRELLDLDARAAARPHPRETDRELGHAGEGERHPRRVHAPV